MLDEIPVSCLLSAGEVRTSFQHRRKVVLKINQRHQKAILSLLHSDYSAFLNNIDRK